MNDELNQKATQQVFSELVGVTQQAVSVHVNTGVLTPGGSYREWIKSYCEHIRNQAAGRAGSNQDGLTTARIEETKISTELKQLTLMEKAGKLVPVEQIEPILVRMVTAARTELLSLPSMLVAEIKALHGVEIDYTLVEEKVHQALNNLSTSIEDIK